MLAALLAAASGASSAAYVTLGGVRHDSTPGYSVASSGTDANGQFAAASASEVAGTVSGALLGPNWPPFLTAGHAVGAYTGTGHPLGTHYTVNGVAPGTELTFVWRISGSHSGDVDAHSFRMEARWGLYNGRNLWLGRFDGLSYVDSTPATGDFAGRSTGTFFCAPNANSTYDACGTAWDANGSRDVWVRDSNDEGWLAAGIEIGGSGSNSIAGYSIELVDVLADPAAFVGSAARPRIAGLSLAAAAGEGEASPGFGPLAGAHIQFDSGRQLAITPAPAASVPLPGTLSLLLAGGGALVAGRRRLQRSRRLAM
jgi:hypothetical protein